MPPWAALEWDRTGWTLEMIPTDAPAWAALRAARWPARPAPMTRTSCSGTGAGFYANGVRAPVTAAIAGRLGDALLERPPDLVPGDDSQQPAVGVDRHQGARSGAAARCRAGPRAGRRSARAGLSSSGAHDLAHLEDRLAVLGDPLGALAVDEADEAAVRVHDREPRRSGSAGSTRAAPARSSCRRGSRPARRPSRRRPARPRSSTAPRSGRRRRAAAWPRNIPMKIEPQRRR